MPRIDSSASGVCIQKGLRQAFRCLFVIKPDAAAMHPDDGFCAP